MVADNDLLKSLGISVGVGTPPTHSPDSMDMLPHTTCDYPFGVVTTLSTTTVIPWLILFFIVFKFRRILFAYLRSNFSYSLSDRNDLSENLTYEYRAGTEIISSVMMRTGAPETLELEISAEAAELSVGEELDAVVIC